MKMKLVYTIKKSDISKGLLTSSKHCKGCGTLLFAQAIKVVDIMGQVLPKDVGKRIYFTGLSYQVENDQQLLKRKKI